MIQMERNKRNERKNAEGKQRNGKMEETEGRKERKKEGQKVNF